MAFAIGQDRPDIAVIGAGAFGAWTALALRERGATVTLIDMHGPGNPYASSGGESRNIRLAYGDRDLYTRWSIRAWDAWERRQDEFGRRLLYRTGSLRVADADATTAQRAVFDRLDEPYEMLTGDEAAYRWPQLNYRDVPAVFFEPRSGIVAAHDAMIAVTDALVRKGGRIVIGRAQVDEAACALTIDGAPLDAGTIVFACGPWLPTLFPRLLGDRIRTPRRELFFLAPAPGDTRYRWDNCPNIAERLWTSSDIGGGFKVAPFVRGLPFDPDQSDRLPTPALLDQVRGFVARRLPGLVDRPIVSTFVAPLENSDNEHFVIDSHPDRADWLIAGGGSGHAFKMGPVIGDHVASLALGDVPDAETATLFALAAHGPVLPGAGG